jgi:hypothetical protein
MYVESLVYPMILQCANEFKSGTVTDVCQSRVAMSTEVPLTDQAFFVPIKNRPPRFQFIDAIRGLFGMELSHTPLVEKLSAAHGITEMHLPMVARVYIAEGRCHPSFSHHGVRFTQE